MQNLSNRLLKIASFINDGERVADIGTDHGFLPIYLRKSGKSPFVIASDIREKPLKSAINNIKKAGIDRIDFRLCDGLSAIEKDAVDAVIIAGMGGECIAGILEFSTWARDSEKHFVLQPMNSPEELRRYLCISGYTVKNECAVSDGGRIYTVLDVYATPDSTVHDEAFYYTGLLNPNVSEDREFLEKQYKRLSTCAKKLEGTEKREEFLSAFNAARYIKEYIGV